MRAIGAGWGRTGTTSLAAALTHLGARLIEWTATDGWEPLCRALDVDVPDEPFPHLNRQP